MAINKALDFLNDTQNFINNNTPLTNLQKNKFKDDGFLLPETYSADGNGLPYTKVPSGRTGRVKRNIISWFIPEFGVVRMYVNPESINYNDKKLISEERTKGGYTLQYWGEQLTTIDISGSTGSSGIEGINLLEQIYRAEQYAFDGVGLTLAASNSNQNLGTNLLKSIGLSGNGKGGVFGEAISGIFGLDSPNNTLAPKNIPSLAQYAFTVEMYYNGVAYRGFFRDFSVQESANNFLLNYKMTFVVTQKRGYRTNYFPFHRSAANGPSSYDSAHSFQSKAQIG